MSTGLDRRVHRCTCGTWCYWRRPCTTCGRDERGSAAWSALIVLACWAAIVVVGIVLVSGWVGELHYGG